MAPDQATFDARTVPGVPPVKWATGDWFRLAQVAYSDQFYPSAGSRLTPSSLTFPCVYIAESKETTVAEVWGDRIAARRERGRKTYTIVGPEVDKCGYLSLRGILPAVWLCDLTDKDTRLAVGIDSGSLYATDLSVPQGWAEVIARHPQRFDGIVYRSRHTDEMCIVLWRRPGESDPVLGFDPAGPFRGSAEAYALARKIGIKLSFSH